jgi:hypothetical protein
MNVDIKVIGNGFLLTTDFGRQVMAFRTIDEVVCHIRVILDRESGALSSDKHPRTLRLTE